MRKTNISLLLVITLLVSLKLSPAALADGDWIVQTVDSPGYVGYYTSIALDVNGYPHISYWDETNENLKYAAFNGSTWDINTVDSSADNIGWHTSIAVDTDGYPHISYFDYTNGELKFAYYSFSVWYTETADSTARVSGYTSIALDADGHQHISYCGGNIDLMYAYYPHARCGYALAGDINDDCRFDFLDFALMATNWLIDCDKTPQDPACIPK